MSILDTIAGFCRKLFGMESKPSGAPPLYRYFDTFPEAAHDTPANCCRDDCDADLQCEMDEVAIIEVDLLPTPKRRKKTTKAKIDGNKKSKKTSKKVKKLVEKKASASRMHRMK